MKKLLIVMTLLFASSTSAQYPTTSFTAGGNITAASASCLATNCVPIKLPASATTLTVGVTGTFSATLAVEESQDGGRTWTSAGSNITGAGTTSFTITAFSDFRVRASAYVSGNAGVNILVSASTNSGGSGVSSLNSLSGAVTIAAGTNVTLTPSGNTITIASTGGGGVGAGAAPIMGFYLSPQCPSVDADGVCVQTFADTQVANDCGWTTSNGVIVCTGNHFVAGDVGKSVMGFSTCSADTTAAQATAGGIAPNVAMPTITAFTSATSVTISATPANAVTITSTAPKGGCFIWGHVDDTAFGAIDTAMQSAPQCPRLFLSAAAYLITKPFFFNNPTACFNLGPGLFNSGGAFPSATAPIGFEIEGRGVGPTTVYLATNFPNGDPCTHVPAPGSAPNEAHGGGCFAIPSGGSWHDFSLSGGGQGNPTNLVNKTLLIMTQARLTNFSCFNYGGYAGGSSVGIELSYLNRLETVNNSGCGSVGIWVEQGVSGNIAQYIIVESSSFNALAIFGSSGSNEPNLWCYYCNFALSNTSTLSPNAVVQNRGGFLRMIGGRIYTYNGNTGANVNNGVVGYLAQITGGSQLFAEGVTFTDGTGGGSNTNGGISCTATCTNTLIGSVLKSQSSGFDIQDVAGSKTFDLGGNTFTPRVSISGNIYGSASITGTQLVTGNVVLTSGWGGTPSTSAFSGSSTSQIWTTTIGTTPGTSAVTTVTFPVPFLVAPTCTASLAGGSSTALIQTSTTATATAATITYTGTLVSGTVITRLACSN